MEPNQPPIKILIVDDDKFLLDMYSFRFKEKGFDTIQAFGSIDALDKLKGGIAPDIILLDIVMPAMDGFELLSIIKNENLAPKAKVVVLSNIAQHTDIEKGRSLGANGYIVKASATPSEVVAKVLAVMDGEDVFTKVD